MFADGALNELSGKKPLYFHSNAIDTLYLRVHYQHAIVSSVYGLATSRRQATTRSNHDPVCRCINASMGLYWVKGYWSYFDFIALLIVHNWYLLYHVLMKSAHYRTASYGALVKSSWAQYLWHLTPSLNKNTSIMILIVVKALMHQ